MLVPLADANPAEIGGKAASLRRLALHGLPVPRAWVIPVTRFRDPSLSVDTRGLPSLLAVRSSALEEDGRHLSFAGQYESVLGVTPEELLPAIHKVWASYDTPRALAYRKGTGEGLAVLVQELVDARSAGVLFTVNPVTGTWREMTVEAVWGLGEPLVGGIVVPDRYVVRRPRRTPRPIQRAIAAIPLTVESQTIAEQHVERVVAGRGCIDRPTEAPFARKLTGEDLRALGRLGLRAESFLGAPQDVEWACDRAGKFWLLQSRPITTRARLPRGGATLWTRRFLGERFPGGASPLGWSLVERVLTWFIAYPETTARYLGGDPPLRLVRGHPYLNVTVFRHLAFKLPGAPPPGFMLDFFPPAEVDAWVRRPAAPPDLRVYASIFATTFRERRWQRFRWNPLSNWRAWDAFREALPARLTRLREAEPDQAPNLIEELLRDYVKVHITSLLFANLYYEIVGPLLSPEERDTLLRAPNGTITATVNGELWEVGRDPARLPGFLARHGHRAAASWEIFSRRWSDEPEAVLKLAALLKGAPDPRNRPVSPSAALARLSPTLRAAVGVTQAYLRLREEQRYFLDEIGAVARDRLRVLGSRWFPEDPDRVRYLVVEELDGRLGADELRRTADRRATETVDPNPPDFLTGDDALPPPTGRRLQGLGISPGVARGRVRVLRSPEEGHRLALGEILVAGSTDPSWTPLFLRAGALVLELGGMLSHGAVVAREYRVPAVCNLPGVTHTLTDGMEVTVDGRSGTVWVHT